MKRTLMFFAILIAFGMLGCKESADIQNEENNDNVAEEKIIYITYDPDNGEDVFVRETVSGHYVPNPTVRFTKEGYVFDGWCLNDEYWAFGTKVYEDMTLVAKWAEIEYTIIFDSNGARDVKQIDVAKTRTIDWLPDVGRNSDHFLGWTFNGEFVNIPFTYEGDEKVIEFKAIFNYVISNFALGDMELEALENGNYGVFSFTKGRDNNVVVNIPSEYKECIITQIGEKAFYMANNIARAVLEEGIKKLCDEAFSWCLNMVAIELPLSIEEIGANAFSQCTKLEFIRYAGTIAEWDAVVKGDGWDNLTGSFKVICSDGEISK